MSKIGRLPIKIPGGLTVNLTPEQISITGPKGTVLQAIHKDIGVVFADNQITVSRSSNKPEHRALHGLTRALIANMVVGVTQGYSQTLEMVGVGYRAEVKGKILELFLGFSHPIVVRPPDGVTCAVIPKESKIIITGIDKQLVGQTAAEIRRFRRPEPYKGKGIRYEGEKVRRKAGKAAAK